MKTKSLSHSPTQFIYWIVPIALTISAFGPYILTYFRTDQIVIYGGILFLVVHFFRINSSKKEYAQIFVIPKSLFWVSILLIIIIVWTGLATIFSNQALFSIRSISNFEKFVQPLAIIAIIAAIGTASRFRPEEHLESVLFVLLGLLVLNTVFALAMNIFNTGPLAKFFVVGPHSTGISDTVWWRARALGRYSGIFNQPYEAGLMYSLGIFGFAYLLRSNTKLQQSHYVMGIIVVIGGFLPVSKVFLLGGLPLFLLFLIVTSRRIVVTGKTIKLGFITVLLMGILITAWQGGDRVMMYIPDPSMSFSDLLNLYFAGRLNKGSYIFKMSQQVADSAPLFGYGFGYTGLFDSGYLEFYLQGGGVALTLYLLILYIIFRNGMWALEQIEGKFLLVIATFTAGISIGMPVLTVNRFSPVIWTVIGLLMYSTIKSQVDSDRPHDFSNGTNYKRGG